MPKSEISGLIFVSDYTEHFSNLMIVIEGFIQALMS